MDSINIDMQISNDRLFDFAASCARLSRPEKGYVSPETRRRRLRVSFTELEKFHARLNRKYNGASRIPAACEWMLDNRYLILREYRVAMDGLYNIKPLRRGSEDEMLYELCAALVRSGEVDEMRCGLFLRGFQSVTVLYQRELDLFAVYLRCAVIDRILAVCRTMELINDGDHAASRLETLFSSLRLFAALDAEKLTEGANLTAAILAGDPTGEYSRMDDATRRAYLKRVEQLAAKQGIPERRLAQSVVDRARAENRHIGYYLFDDTPHRKRAGAYIAANVLFTLILTLALAFITGRAVNALLLLLPVWELVKSLMDWLILRRIKPREILRMDIEGDVPPEGKTLCVSSVLLTDETSARAAAEKLERLSLSQRGGRNLCFGLLADLKGADEKTAPEDESILAAAKKAIHVLNRRYGGGFFLFTRDRSFDGEQWTGFERKRGALIELAKLLSDRENALHVTGERDELAGTRFILTLDADTEVYPGAMKKLIGAMLHPLCRPVIDRERAVVVSGHGILHPRVSNELMSANETDFALCYSGGGGSDAYGGLCAELYMDAFGSGGFAGKGIIDIESLLVCTEAHIPNGQVLSHDALEGAFLRGGFVGDTEFFDAFPSKPLGFYKRLHRWVRGDWQNAPWIFRRGRALSDIDRWRLFDSLRRSATPPMTFIALLCGLFVPELLSAAAWAALFAMTSRLFICLTEHRPRTRPRLRHYTRTLSGVGGAIVQSFLRLWLLPYEAWVCAGAIATALWRMLVSHRKMLEWQTAAQSAAGKDSYFVRMLPFVLSGAALVFFSPVVIGKAAGLMWALSPLCTYALALPARKKEELTGAQRTFLKTCAEKTWSYFETFCTAEDNYLPPDNFQTEPPVGTAHRTSPTNIGFAAASAVAAADLEIITRREASEFITRIVDTLERMPRALGHFLNWYDTRTLRPLQPEYISTVDSGNLYAGLLVCRQAMEEWGYDSAANKIRDILRRMDFAPLYDKKRGLFRICYDAAADTPAGGYYDLMASEARLTSFIAAAKGDVPAAHWRNLSRAQLQKDGYRGLASWTGTMFEYLMPELFLPLYPSSLLFESARFCLYAQKKRVYPGTAWGISESAFFALDNELNYRYKAHGCQALALKRGQDAELVISPYASFLALAVEPQAAVKNLMRLKNIGADCRFGFIEAIDRTPARTRSLDGERVQCCMAHHEGMSMLAAANALCDESITKRFMSDPAMASCRTLLCEHVSDDEKVIRRDKSPTPERTSRPERSWERTGAAGEEAACVLSNGVYNMKLSSDGESTASLGTRLVYRERELLELSVNGEPLMPQSFVFTEDRAEFDFGEGVRETVSVPAACPGEVRKVHLPRHEDKNISLTLCFEPILAAAGSYASHPAFWRLGLYAAEQDGRLCIRRLARGPAGEMWLCLASNRAMRFSADRNGTLGWLSAPYVTACVQPDGHAGESEDIVFALCVGNSREDAVKNAEYALENPGERGTMPASASARLGMSISETDEAMNAVYKLWKYSAAGAVDRRELWKYGVSGDYPMLVCEDERKADSFVRRFCMLLGCGVECELVLLSTDAGKYDRPFYRHVSDLLASFGLEALLGARGGVHIVPQEAHGAVLSHALSTLPRINKLDTEGTERESSAIPEYRFGEAFAFTVRDSLPARAWQNVLTNGAYGYLASDAGTGFMWYKNAREMPVTPYENDPYTVRGAEQLAMKLDGKLISLFAANDGYECRVQYAPGSTVWEKRIGGIECKVTAFVPKDTDARVLIIETSGQAELIWQTELPLGTAPECVTAGSENGDFTAVNADGLRFSACVSADSAKYETDFAPAAVRCTIKADDTTVIACGVCSRDKLRKLCDTEKAMRSYDSTREHWRKLTETKLHGSDRIDRYLRPWCAYQCIAGRILGRTSLYQSGGAYGFRDQLQDAVNIIPTDASFAHDAILRACRHQYLEGDVMHWWHEESRGDKGVRTRCSDDLLWLVWAVCEYADKVSDDICGKLEPYITSPVLGDDEPDRYETAKTASGGSVLEHAMRAMELFMARPHGEHGLPLFGSGDWNDGLDKVGGESVWLGFFASCCADMLCKLTGEEKYREYAEKIGRAADACRADGYYLRGYFADGTPLGRAGHIDSVAQSWAVFCPYSDKSFAKTAVTTALKRLVDEEHGIVRLFDPPFEDETHVPGYIQSYGPGFRENGGQYTHGAIWLARACLMLGMREKCVHLLELLLPESHELTRYKAEPYVLAADIYSASGHEGEAGWTWYTGSAGWYFRTVCELDAGE